MSAPISTNPLNSSTAAFPIGNASRPLQEDLLRSLTADDLFFSRELPPNAAFNACDLRLLLIEFASDFQPNQLQGITQAHFFDLLLKNEINKRSEENYLLTLKKRIVKAGGPAAGEAFEARINQDLPLKTRILQLQLKVVPELLMRTANFSTNFADCLLPSFVKIDSNQIGQEIKSKLLRAWLHFISKSKKNIPWGPSIPMTVPVHRLKKLWMDLFASTDDLSFLTRFSVYLHFPAGLSLLLNTPCKTGKSTLQELIASLIAANVQIPSFVPFWRKASDFAAQPEAGTIAAIDLLFEYAKKDSTYQPLIARFRSELLVEKKIARLLRPETLKILGIDEYDLIEFYNGDVGMADAPAAASSSSAAAYQSHPSMPASSTSSAAAAASSSPPSWQTTAQNLTVDDLFYCDVMSDRETRVIPTVYQYRMLLEKFKNSLSPALFAELQMVQNPSNLFNALLENWTDEIKNGTQISEKLLFIKKTIQDITGDKRFTQQFQQLITKHPLFKVELLFTYMEQVPHLFSQVPHFLSSFKFLLHRLNTLKLAGKSQKFYSQMLKMLMKYLSKSEKADPLEWVKIDILISIFAITEDISFLKEYGQLISSVKAHPFLHKAICKSGNSALKEIILNNHAIQHLPNFFQNSILDHTFIEAINLIIDCAKSKYDKINYSCICEEIKKRLTEQYLSSPEKKQEFKQYVDLLSPEARRVLEINPNDFNRSNPEDTSMETAPAAASSSSAAAASSSPAVMEDLSQQLKVGDLLFGTTNYAHKSETHFLRPLEFSALFDGLKKHTASLSLCELQDFRTPQEMFRKIINYYERIDWHAKERKNELLSLKRNIQDLAGIQAVGSFEAVANAYVGFKVRMLLNQIETVPDLFARTPNFVASFQYLLTTLEISNLDGESQKFCSDLLNTWMRYLSKLPSYEVSQRLGMPKNLRKLFALVENFSFLQEFKSILYNNTLCAFLDQVPCKSGNSALKTLILNADVKRYFTSQIWAVSSPMLTNTYCKTISYIIECKNGNEDYKEVCTAFKCNFSQQYLAKPAGKKKLAPFLGNFSPESLRILGIDLNDFKNIPVKDVDLRAAEASASSSSAAAAAASGPADREAMRLAAVQAFRAIAKQWREPQLQENIRRLFRKEKGIPLINLSTFVNEMGEPDVLEIRKLLNPFVEFLKTNPPASLKKQLMDLTAYYFSNSVNGIFDNQTWAHVDQCILNPRRTGGGLDFENRHSNLLGLSDVAFLLRAKTLETAEPNFDFKSANATKNSFYLRFEGENIFLYPLQSLFISNIFAGFRLETVDGATTKLLFEKILPGKRRERTGDDGFMITPEESAQLLAYQKEHRGEFQIFSEPPQRLFTQEKAANPISTAPGITQVEQNKNAFPTDHNLTLKRKRSEEVGEDISVGDEKKSAEPADPHSKKARGEAKFRALPGFMPMGSEADPFDEIKQTPSPTDKIKPLSLLLTKAKSPTQAAGADLLEDFMQQLNGFAEEKILRCIETRKVNTDEALLNSSSILTQQLADVANHCLLHPFEDSLKTYQKNAVEWMLRTTASGLGCVLASEPGLGKTRQAIEVIRQIQKRDGGGKTNFSPRSRELDCSMGNRDPHAPF